MSGAIPSHSTPSLRSPVPPGEVAPTDVHTRLLAALGIAGIALIHILNAPDAYASARYIFWLYMALVAVSVPMITLLLQWQSPKVWVASSVLAAAPFFSYLLSRSVGLPADTGEIGDWVDPLGLASLFVEASLLVLSLTRLRTLSRPVGPVGRTNLTHRGQFARVPTARVAQDGARSRTA